LCPGRRRVRQNYRKTDVVYKREVMIIIMIWGGGVVTVGSPCHISEMMSVCHPVCHSVDLRNRKKDVSHNFTVGVLYRDFHLLCHLLACELL